jgi:hypothetical protein
MSLENLARKAEIRRKMRMVPLKVPETYKLNQRYEG